MRKRRIVPIIVAVILIVGIIKLLLYVNFFRSTHTVEEVEGWVRTELPPGSSVPRTYQFLQSHDVQNYSYDEETRTLYAGIDNTYRGILITCGIYMRFYYDHQELLHDHVVEKICTGL